MAIGFNLPGIPGQIRGTAEEAGAVPDLSQAMIKGFRSNVENVQGYPRLLAQQLVSNQLANTINRAKAKYAEPMAKTSYDQALANLQHQGLINQYYGRMRESELASAGLSQEHQRMANEQARMKLSLYKDAYNAFKNMGATHDQAHNAAVQQVQQQAPQQGALREPYVPEFAAMLTGKNMPEYLSNIAPEQQAAQSYADSLMLAPEQPQGYTPLQPNLFEPQYSQRSMELSMPVESMLLAPELPQGYTPAQQNLFEPSYSQRPMEMQLTGQRPMAMELRPEEQAMAAPEYLQRPMEMELTEGMPARMPAPQQAQEQPVSYAQQLQQAGFNTDNVKPGYAEADELYIKSPLHRKILEEMSPGTGIKTYNDFPRNRQITTMTLPSGATKTTIQSLGGAQGGAPDFKAQSPTGKLLEDLRHYRETNNKEGEEFTKKALDKAVKEGQLELEQLLNKRDEYQAAGDYGRAQDFQDLIDAKKRGATTTINLGKNEYFKTDPKTGEKLGYYRPQTTEEQRTARARVGFTYAYPNIIKGTEPYSGDISKGTARLVEDINNYKLDPKARERLINLGVGQKFKILGALGEMQASGSPKVKIALQKFGETVDPRSVIGAKLQDFLSKSYGTDPELNNEIDSIFDQKFKEMANLQEQEQIKNLYIPFDVPQKSEKKTLAKNISSGAKNIKAANVIKVTPEMVKGL